MKTQLTNYIRAGYPGLYIVSHEEARIESEIKSVAKDLKFGLYVWSLTEGINNAVNGASIPETQDPINALDHLAKLPEKSIMIFRDFHLILVDSQGMANPMVARKVRDVLAIGKNSNRVMIIVGCALKMPAELEKEIVIVDFALPDRDQLRDIITKLASDNGIDVNGDMDGIVDAACGLTTIETENAVALSIIEEKKISATVVQREKANTIKKNGLLEIVSNSIKLSDIGGLENLKQDLKEKRNLFTQKARNYGLRTPRGILMVGQPGTGKSLTASATASTFGIPLIRLEAGRLFGSLVGESERNWRTAFATVKAISPCVLWVDEIDGLFAGAQSSGHTDGGTTARVVKTILQDMQFNGEGIFFVFTANDIDGLPDPLIDRLDVWSVDLPNDSERQAIWAIHIAKRGRKPSKFPLVELAALTDGFSGRQIEQVWEKSMNLAFNEKGREPNSDDVRAAAKRFVPTSVTMADAINRRRERLKNRATPASVLLPEKREARQLVATHS